jgi:glucan 1,3-beta-glucosidase
VLWLADREKFHVNVIEAYDEPWKRALEGTVGGHWGLIDDATREPKFFWGQPVSNHPWWRWQAAGGVAFVIVVFAAAFGAKGDAAPPRLWLAVTANAIAGGGLIGWTLANVPVESLGIGGWLRSLTFAALALCAPPTMSAGVMRGVPLPRLSAILAPASGRVRDPLSLSLGAILIGAMLLAIVTALGLVFDPRYKDFPFAPLTAVAVALASCGLGLKRRSTIGRSPGEHGAAEVAGAAVLGLSVPYIVLNEGFANWQSLWLCGALAVLAFSLAQARDVQG